MAKRGVERVRFDPMYESLCQSMAEAGTVEVTTGTFAEMLCDTTRVAFALNQAEIHKHITPPPAPTSQKESKKSQDQRENGNLAFKDRDFETALNYYSESIYWAPNSKEDDTDCLSLGHANRSAALFHLKRYPECIADIDYALEHNYPKNMQHKLYERKGRCYANMDKLDQAQKNFNQTMSCLEEVKMEKKKKKAMEKSFDDCLVSCRKRMQSPKQEKFKIVHNCSQPAFDGPQNEVFGSLSSSVDVEYNEEKGRYIVAKEYLPAGKIVMIEKPYASVLLPYKARTHCHHCLKRTITPLPCLSCANVGFCSKKCRAQAMETYHRVECKCLAILRKSALDKFSFLAVRSVLKQPLKDLLAYRERLAANGFKYDSDNVLKGCTEEKKYVPDNFHAIHSLVTHSGDRKVHDLYRRTVTAVYLLKCLQHAGYFNTKKGKDKLATKENMAFIGGLLLSHLQLLPCNAHEVSELFLDPLDVANSTTQETGAGIYATLSLFNHSCTPAATRHFHGDVCVVRTIRGVHAGEEVSDNYGTVFELHALDHRRTEVLAPQYYFTCHCDACDNDWPQFDALQSLPTRWRCRCCLTAIDQRDDSAVKKCDVTFNKEKVSELEEQFKKAESDFHTAFAHLLRCQWERALPLLVSYLEVLDNVVPPHRAFSNCQEALKQCYNFMGNCHITRLETDIH